ncbi:Molybdopterin molybdenumtransferase [hydrothermal vent metagenome]|uniref:molybdopterin molybdotransferase n=1 Tax=hydrothermal vent metagenome TaxID=652676 RepID=A0A3B0ZLK8_9ZZZZ
MSACDSNTNSLISVDQALDNILSAIQAVTHHENVALKQSLGRVLAVPIKSPIDIPSFDNSAMDGYALPYQQATTEVLTLINIGTAWAGKPFAGTVKQGECVRIMTGAVIPDGCDTVVMQEQVTVADKTISFPNQMSRGQNIRWQAEEIKSGDTVLNPGKLLMAVDTGLLASVGVTEVMVYRKPRVAFFSTGDELKPVGSPLVKGQIYDSNRYLINSMLTRLGVDLLDMGVITDDPELIQAAFEQASEVADMVITSGGVSVGDADHVQDILQTKGQVNFWRVAMKPGKPMAVGKFNNAHFFGLPGNPVSALVTFYQFTQPALKKLMGCEQYFSPIIKARSLDTLKKFPGRQEYQRGILSTDENGESVVSTTGLQGSHILTSMSLANCFIILARENDGVNNGDLVDVQPFYGII